MKFAIVPLSADTDALRKKIENLDSSFYDMYAPSVFFLSFNGTAESLSNRLGFTGKEGTGSGLVLGVHDYFGLANKSLWDWLRA